jgi:hypothetical protein
MELKNLSSNWKKLQPTLKQKNVASDRKATDQGRERPQGVKRKRAEKGSLLQQHAPYPPTKRRKPSAGMGVTYSGQDKDAPVQAPPIIRSVAQSATPSIAADRVNEGLSQTYVAPDHRPFSTPLY